MRSDAAAVEPAPEPVDDDPARAVAGAAETTARREALRALAVGIAQEVFY